MSDRLGFHYSCSLTTSILMVKPDDKLTSIAACFDTTPSIIKKINRLSMEFLYPDQVGCHGNKVYILFYNKALLYCILHV
ncbi:hypothetical protein EB796_008842 [Bugula neritina]|uniref:LysM domain-containing protein n=1 Tax=Bugula neritina TaxID=10212 RepID=A0A7J7K5I0_BUGNE|nr:hypothetical protein EB796_008842 [Bugula neritina]